MFTPVEKLDSNFRLSDGTYTRGMVLTVLTDQLRSNALLYLTSLLPSSASPCKHRINRSVIGQTHHCMSITIILRGPRYSALQ